MTQDEGNSLSKEEQLAESFAIEANERFHLNMLTFKQSHPNIYQMFQSYQPGEKYQLMLNDNGTTNIIDYDTGSPLYSDDPIIQSFLLVQRALLNPQLHHKDLSYASEIRNDANFIHLDLVKSLGKIIDTAKEKLPVNNTVDNNIPSQIIFGVGLGYHLFPLLNSTIPLYISILEPNKDYFFASLFAFDWHQYIEMIKNNGSYLYIGIDDCEEDMYQNLHNDIVENQTLGRFSPFFFTHYPSKNIAKLVEKTRNNIHQLQIGFGFFDDALMSVSHTLGVINKSPAMINHSSNFNKSFANYPVFIVANGPSIDQDLQKIKQLQNHAIIVSCNSATTALLANDITPDFHVALERTKSTADFLSAHISEQDRKKINLLVLNVMYPDTLDLFDWTGIALKPEEPGTLIYQLAQANKGNATSVLEYCNPLVGNTALSFIINLGFNNIYLFGMDNGYIDKSHHHSKSSYYYDDSGDEVYKPIDIGDEFSAEGNFGEMIKTDPFLFCGNQQMQLLLNKYLLSEFDCHNCSDGLKIIGTTPLKSEKIKLPATQVSKSTIIDKIKKNNFSQIDKTLNIESYLDFDFFEEICLQLVKILNKTVNNRSDGLLIINEYSNYLDNFKNNLRYKHLFSLLKGETLYINSLLISLLFRHGDDESIIPYFEEALKYWREFLQQAPKEYRTKWNVHSNCGFDYEKGSYTIDS
jgi:hypothetical protein